MAENPEPPRALVAGKYRLTRLLGRGGMGSVWEGVHTTLSTRVAVKFIEAEHTNSAEARSRFENEARAAASLRSKYVVEVYDHGVTEDGRPFIVMEYLEGEPLDRRLERLGRLPAKEAAFILQQVCRALAKAHAARIVHRDLKPENVFLVWDDEDGADIVKVVDFGIAKFTDGSPGPSSATRTGSVLGTPYYMSPEQARGLRSVDFRTDIWSLGVIAYRCIVGTLPFDGEGIGDLLVKLCTAPVPIPSQVAPDVPPGFDAFIARALSREPAERFQSVQEFGASLAAVCGISVRAYATGESPLGPGNAQGTGPFPALAPAQSGAMREAPAVATGAPLSQTAPTPTPGAARTGAIVAASFAAFVVLAIGVGVLAKVRIASDAAPLSPASAVSLGGPAANVPLVMNVPSAAPPPSASSSAPAEPVPSATPKPSPPAVPARALAVVPPHAPSVPPVRRTAEPTLKKGLVFEHGAAASPAGAKPPAGAKKEIDLGY